MAARTFAFAVCALILVAGSMQADAPLKSGPPVDSKNNRRGFTPKWVTGPCAGKHLCPV